VPARGFRCAAVLGRWLDALNDLRLMGLGRRQCIIDFPADFSNVIPQVDAIETGSGRKPCEPA
jgi:hypothetical protein